MIERAATDFRVPQVQPVGGDQGAAAAEAFSGIRQSIGGVQRVVQDNLRKKQLADDSAALLDVENKYSQRVLEIELEAQKEAAESGDGYLKAVREQRGTAAGEILNGIPSYASTEARNQAALLVKRLDGDSDKRATVWQDGQATAFALKGFNTALSTAAGEVMADPSEIEQKKTASMTRLASIAGRLTPEEEEAARLRIDSELSFSAIKGYADANNFSDARSTLKAFAGSLTGDQQRSLNSYIDQGETRHEQEVYEAFSLQVSEGTIDEAGLKSARDAGAIPDDGYYRSLKEQLAVRRNQEQLAEKQALADLQAQNFAALRVGIDDGKKTRADVDQLYRRDQINDSQWAQAALAANDKAAETKYADAFVGNLGLGIPVNPSDPDMKKGAEAVFKMNGGKDLFVEDFPAAMEKTASFAEAGIIPETPVGILRGMKASGTPEQQVAAIGAISELYTDYPNATDAAFTAGEVAEAISYRHKLDAGIDPQVAYQAILKEREARNEPQGAASQTKLRIADGRKIAKDFDRKEALADVNKGGFLGFGVRFSGGALAEEQVVSDFREAFQSYYIQHGDEELAKKQARATLQRTVSTSRANGGRVMLYPPEKYYPDTGDRNWMRDSLATGVSELKGLEVKADEIELVSDAETARAIRQTGLPSYAVQITTGDTVEVLPYRWTFDEEAAQKRAEAKAAAEQEQGRDRAAQKRLRRAERNVAWSTPDESSVAWKNMSELERQVAREAHDRAVKDLENARKEAGQ